MSESDIAAISDALVPSGSQQASELQMASGRIVGIFALVLTELAKLEHRDRTGDLTVRQRRRLLRKLLKMTALQLRSIS